MQEVPSNVTSESTSKNYSVKFFVPNFKRDTQGLLLSINSSSVSPSLFGVFVTFIECVLLSVTIFVLFNTLLYLCKSLKHYQPQWATH